MGYYIDLEKISIDDYKTKIESAYLPPSRMILKEQLDERFGYFKSAGIQNLQELMHHLKKKDKLHTLQITGCFPGDYLTILLRELNSLLPKPNKIDEFSGISSDTIRSLEKVGIKNTQHLFNKVINADDRKNLSEQTGIPEPEILELTRLSDLSRIKWVGVSFARMLYDVGIDCVEKASKCNPEKLHAEINRINKEKQLYKGQIGLNDIRIFIEAAKDVPLDIKY